MAELKLNGQEISDIDITTGNDNFIPDADGKGFLLLIAFKIYKFKSNMGGGMCGNRPKQKDYCKEK